MELTLPAGRIIHYQGLPFRLMCDTSVDGDPANLRRAEATDQHAAKVPGGFTENTTNGDVNRHFSPRL